MSKSIFMRVDEVAEILDVSEAYAYKLIRRLNKELAKTGCITISGRIDRNFSWNSSTTQTNCRTIRRVIKHGSFQGQE